MFNLRFPYFKVLGETFAHLRDLPQYDNLFDQKLLPLHFDILIDDYGPPLPKIIPLLQLGLKLLPFEVASDFKSFLGALVRHLRLHVEGPCFYSWQIRLLITL